jgi:hypothetical protein
MKQRMKKEICSDLSARLLEEADLSERNGAKTWHNAETKHQSLEWKSPESLRPKMHNCQNHRSTPC